MELKEVGEEVRGLATTLEDRVSIEESSGMTERSVEILKILATAIEMGEGEFTQLSAAVRRYTQDASVIRR